MKKFEQFLFLLLCATYFLFRGRATKKVKIPKSILIAQLAKMGDMVCTTPIFRAVKNKFPECKVYVLGDSVNEKVLEENPDVDGYIVYKRNFFETLRIIKKKKFDFACLTRPGPEIFTLLYLAGIPTIAVVVVTEGFAPQQNKVYRLIKNFAVSIQHRMGQYAPLEYLRLLAPIGIFTDNTDKHLGYSKDADGRVLKFLDSRGVKIGRDFIVGIAPGTGENKIKLWGRDKFAKLADHLHEKLGAKIVIVGGPGDRPEVEEMVCSLRHTTHFLDTSMFSIDELKALISKLSLFISVDTGPIYIAEAFKVPTINIVGPVDEREQPPIGERHVVVTPPFRKRAEISIMNSRVFDIAEARRQSDEITAEMVISESDKLIEKLKLDISSAKHE